MESFQYITPFIYLLLVVIWSYILYFYLRKIYKRSGVDKLLLTLLIVLAVDAFRTLFESVFFGVWYTSLSGLIPISIYNFLAQPQIVFFPKIINLLVSFIILAILIKRWIPAETSRQNEQSEMIRHRTKELQKTIDHLNSTKNDLLEQQQLFEIMLNTIPDGVVIADTKRKIILANNGMKSTFGYLPEELIGNTTEMLYADSEKYIDTGSKFYTEKSKGTDNLYLTKYKTKDGLVFPGETFGKKLHNSDGTWKGNLGIMRNVSERIEFIKEINNQRDKAQEADRLKSAFLSNMSHEIRTPMNGIVGFTSLIQKPDLSDEKRQKYLGLIQKSSVRMLSTVNNIIEISKIETGHIEITSNYVRISEQLEYLYNFFKPEVENSNMELILKNELSQDDDFIETDELKLNSILTNLIKNAIKYSHEGFITISCRKEKLDLIFSIQDSGIGIEESRREAIFDRFVQADIEDRGAYEGSGLGLSIAKSYVEMLGGKIWVESEPGKGSTFSFSIEWKQATRRIDSKKEKSEPVLTDESNSINILVAEDDHVSFLLIENILEDTKYKILRAENGKQTLEVFMSGAKIDVILMDLKMPVMDGFEATKLIRELDKDIPIIAQSAYAFAGDRKKAMECGCTDFIAKPLDQKKLIFIINSYVHA